MILTSSWTFAAAEQTQIYYKHLDENPETAQVEALGVVINIPTPQAQNAIRSIIKSVSPQYLKTYLIKLQNFGSRLYRAPGMFNASIWLHDVLAGNGRLTTAYHNFTVVRPPWGTFNLSNVILTLPGLNTSSDRIYYMFAHSDAVQSTDSSQWLNNTPGADDDGSGCAAVLEAARVLSRYDFQDTIKFAFFNAEEIGLVGSAEYAEDMTEWSENVTGSINYDMIGYSTGTAQYDLTLMYNPASAQQGLYMLGVNDRYNIGLSIRAIRTSSFIPSDISSFYFEGFPGVFGIEEEFNPYYHTIYDLVKYINFTLVDKCTRLAVASLAEMARLLYVDVSIPPGNISTSNSKPIEDENVTVKVNITNTGNLDANDLEVVFYSDGLVFASNRLSVPANGSNTSTAYWDATTGLHNISVVLDPKNEIVETDETNNTASMLITVNDRPRPVFTATPMLVLTNESVLFNGSLSYDLVGGVAEYNFSFGDGNSTGWTGSPSITHVYLDDGIYIATLIVRDIHGLVSNHTNLSVHVLNRAPFASPGSNLSNVFTFSPIQFYSNASDVDGQIKTNWAFGDGTKSEEPEPVHSYLKSGIYDVQLNVTDDDGAEVDYHINIIVHNRPPICSINPDNRLGNITTKFTFRANATDADGSITSYTWDLGDGSFAYSDLVTHQYSKPGGYKIELLVRDDEGANAKAMVFINILDLPPVAAAQVSPTKVLTFENVFFNGKESLDLEGPITYSWSFGDGNGSLEPEVSHVYINPGNYTPTLSVKDSIGQATTLNLTTIQVLNRPPVALFRVMGNLTVNSTILFDGTKSYDPEGKITHQWMFGDGSGAEDSVVEHVYPKAGNYTVYLTVTDKDESRDTVYQTITITSIIIEKPKPEPPNNTTNTSAPTNTSNTSNTTNTSNTSNSSNTSKNGQEKITPNQPANNTNQKTSEHSGFITMLIVMNIILVILLILVFLWMVIRKKKEPQPPAEPEPPGEPQPPPPEKPDQSTSPTIAPSVQPPTSSEATNAPSTIHQNHLTINNND